MPVDRITSADDPRVLDYRAVREPDLCGGAASSSPRAGSSSPGCSRSPATRSARSSSSEAGLAALRTQAADGLDARPDLPVYVAAPEIIDAIGGFHFHRGCLAVAERPPAQDAGAIIAAAAPGHPLVVVEALAQADNVGSILRNAQAFGAAGVLLDPATVDPLYRKALRTAMGAALVVPWARLEPWPDALARVRAAGVVDRGTDAATFGTTAERLRDGVRGSRDRAAGRRRGRRTRRGGARRRGRPGPHRDGTRCRFRQRRDRDGHRPACARRAGGNGAQSTRAPLIHSPHSPLHERFYDWRWCQ